MRIYYFDTSVYNKILDSSERKKLIKRMNEEVHCGNVRIIASLTNLEEILLESNVARRKQLIQLTRHLTYSSAFDDPPEILRRDFDSFLRSRTQSTEAFSDLDWPMLLKRAESDELLSDKEWLEARNHAHARKKKFEKESKQHQKELLPLWQEYNGKVSFELFYMKSLALSDLIEGWMTKVYGLENAQILAPQLKENLAKFARLRCLLKYCFGLIFDQLVTSPVTKPDYGDSFDMLHAIQIGSCQVFVTADKIFLKT